MAAKAQARIAAEDAAEAARQAEWEAAHPPVPGEDGYLITGGGHAGHRTHTHPFHGNAVVCQCGEIMGCFSIVIPEDPLPLPDSCPVCTARGTVIQSPDLDPRDGWRQYR
jgi:hypothetical protein